MIDRKSGRFVPGCFRRRFCRRVWFIYIYLLFDLTMAATFAPSRSSFVRALCIAAPATSSPAPKPVSFASARIFSARPVCTMAASGNTGITPVEKSAQEWRTILSPEQFRILRQKGTEYPGTGKYNKHREEGVYECAGCGTPLYKSTTKFDSGCGWPAFYEGLPGAITETPDPDGRRIEITCTACGGHLGHVFKGEGFKNPVDARHCVNSVSLTFTPANK